VAERVHGAGLTYRVARLTTFSQQARTACGTHGADVGPFCCPASFGVYLDPAFFAALSGQVGVHLGGVAQAYVVAHEIGHQQNAAGERRPSEEWTHGSSAQRQRWLTTGVREGTPGCCDTFNA
jgi:predicted metalloprotease